MQCDLKRAGRLCGHCHHKTNQGTAFAAPSPGWDLKGHVVNSIETSEERSKIHLRQVDIEARIERKQIVQSKQEGSPGVELGTRFYNKSETLG